MKSLYSTVWHISRMAVESALLRVLKKNRGTVVARYNGACSSNTIALAGGCAVAIVSGLVSAYSAAIIYSNGLNGHAFLRICILVISSIVAGLAVCGLGVVAADRFRRISVFIGRHGIKIVHVWCFNKHCVSIDYASLDTLWGWKGPERVDSPSVYYVALSFLKGTPYRRINLHNTTDYDEWCHVMEDLSDLVDVNVRIGQP